MDDITTTVVPNDRGTEDVQILVNETDGTTLAQAIEAAATDALKVHMRRKEFSGKIQISVPGSIPVAQRKEIPPVIERLRELCAQLSTGQAPYRVTLMYRREPAAAVSPTESAAQLAAAVSSQPPSALRASSVTRTRVWLGAGIVLAIVVVLGVRYLMSGPFPRSIEFGRLHLTKSTEWDLIGVNGGVYTLPGRVESLEQLAADFLAR